MKELESGKLGNQLLDHFGEGLKHTGRHVNQTLQTKRGGGNNDKIISPVVVDGCQVEGNCQVLQVCFLEFLLRETFNGLPHF